MKLKTAEMPHFFHPSSISICVRKMKTVVCLKKDRSIIQLNYKRNHLSRHEEGPSLALIQQVAGGHFQWYRMAKITVIYWFFTMKPTMTTPINIWTIQIDLRCMIEITKNHFSSFFICSQKGVIQPKFFNTSHNDQPLSTFIH